MTKWQCLKCKRRFKNKNQVHSCTVYPLKKHFSNKGDLTKSLYKDLQSKITKNIGSFKVRSLPCCIHFDRTATFVGVYAMKDKIRLHFSLDKKLNSKRIKKYSSMSAKRFLFELDIINKKEIDKELIGWLGRAYQLK
ncbi:DUF5655 domain-containing protein [Patescibacteria group bacterium]